MTAPFVTALNGGLDGTRTRDLWIDRPSEAQTVADSTQFSPLF